MEIPRANSRLAENTGDQSNLLNCDLFGFEHSFLHKCLDFLCEGLGNVADLVVGEQQVAQLVTAEFRQHQGKPRLQHLEEELRPAMAEHKAPRDLLQTLIRKLADVSHDSVFQLLLEERSPKATNSEPTRTCRNFVNRQLAEPPDEHLLQDHE